MIRSQEAINTKVFIITNRRTSLVLDLSGARSRAPVRIFRHIR
jgi:hypothetical protein